LRIEHHRAHFIHRLRLEHELVETLNTRIT